MTTKPAFKWSDKKNFFCGFPKKDKLYIGPKQLKNKKKKQIEQIY